MSENTVNNRILLQEPCRQEPGSNRDKTEEFLS